ncbi:MAG: hypothetical protein K8T10_04690 [Candidatus Eremiobacteraeota bacterium]|nr:hypothetical protein [Candidatus Eremiobacteraeota bacterium]
MPRLDGQGPQGMGGGRGMGLGASGECVCTNCGHTQPHQRGVPCNAIKCPKCGTTMSRKG